jgi:hypothetical protein
LATDALPRRSLTADRGEAVAAAAYRLGALSLAGEAAVHVQQYASLLHEVRWIGPLFLANAAASVVTIDAVGRCSFCRRAAAAFLLLLSMCKAALPHRRRSR